MISTATKIKKILLIDDDTDDCVFFQEALKEAELDVSLRVSNDSKCIIELLDTEDLPDIIFLDLNMPAPEGKECLRIIRKIKNLDKIPVVIFSTSCLADDVEETFSAGANLYVQKPAGFKLLTHVLKTVIGLNWEKYVLNPDRSRYVFTNR